MSVFFVGLYTYFKKHKAVLWVSVALLTVLFALAASRIRMQEDITQFIPQNDKVSNYTSVLQNIRLNDRLVIAVHLPDTATVPDPMALIDYGQALTNKLNEGEASSLIRDLRFKLSDSKAAKGLDVFYRNLPFFLEEQDYRAIEQMITDSSVTQSLQNNYRTLLTPSGVAFKENIARDPLGLTKLALKKLSYLQVQGNFVVLHDCIFTSDKKNLLIFLETSMPANETSINGKLLESVDEAILATDQQMDGDVTAGYYGAVAVAVGNAQQIKKDTILTMGLALGLLLLLLSFFYRRKRFMLFMMFPVMAGALFSLAMVWMIQGELSTIAIGAGSIILGIAINYSIHFFTHFKHTASAEESIRDLSIPMTIGSITTIGAFLSLLFVDSKALQDFGLFAALVLVGSVLFTLIVLPHMTGKPRTDEGSRHNHTFIERLSSIRFENSKIWIWVIVILTAVLLYFAPQVGFDNDLSNMSYVTPEVKLTEQRLNQITDTNLRAIYVVSEDTSLNAALLRNERITKQLEKLNKTGKVYSYSSPGKLLFSDSLQRVKAARWNDFWAIHRVDLQKKLEQSADSIGFAEDAFSPFFNFITTPASGYNRADEQLIKEQFVRDYVMEEPGKTMVIAMVKAHSGNRDALMQALPENENTAIIDRQHLMSVFAEVISNDFNTILIFTSLLVFIFLVMSYGRLELGLLAFIPMLISWIWILGLMALFGVQFNIFSIILSAFIFGLGDDYSIFIMDGLLQEYKTGRKNLDSFKTAVFLSALTTMIGVGVLIFAKHPALRSVALTTIIGMLSVVIVSYTVAPAIFKWMTQIGSKKRTFPVTLGGLIYAIVFYGYFIGGCVMTVLAGWTWIRILPIGRKKRKQVYHYLLYIVCRSTIFVMFMAKKRFINIDNDTFKKPALVICNHQSIIDIPLALMFSPKMVMITNERVYYSPLIGRLVRLGGFFPSTRGFEEISSSLKELIADGYSIFVFPEGTRAEDRKPKRFHKGAFYLAEQLGLDILPLVMHGTGEYIKKGEYFGRRSAITVKALDRIKPGDKQWGSNYSERTKSIQKAFHKEFYEIRQAYYTSPDYHKDLLLRNYIYKGPVLEWYMKVKIKLEDNYRYFDQVLPKAGRITDIGCGYGFLSYMLAMISPDRKVLGLDYDDDKILVANSGISRPSNTEFISGDAMALPFPRSNAFVIADVLHYMPEDWQLGLIRKCMDHLEPGGLILIREGDASLEKKHKGTVITEFFSTRVLSFNKTQAGKQLHFTSRELIYDSIKNTIFDVEIVDDTRFTSNVFYLIREKGEGNSIGLNNNVH